MSGYPAFWLLVAAVVAPLLAEIPLGFKIPVVVLEVLLGIALGPHGLGLLHFDGLVAAMFASRNGRDVVHGRHGARLGKDPRPPARCSRRAVGSSRCWLALAVVGVLHVVPYVDAPIMVALALATTSLGVLLPVFRDSGQLDTPFGSLFLAAGTIGEVGPIVVMSLVLSHATARGRKPDSWSSSSASSSSRRRSACAGIRRGCSRF